MDMLGQVLRRIDTAMLTARAPEREHQAGKPSLDIACHMGIGQPIHAVEEGEYLTVVLQKTYHGLVETSEFFVGLITPGIVRTAAVEDIPSAVARLIFGNPLAVGETVDPDHQRPLAVVFRERGGTIGLVGVVDVALRGAQTVGAYRRFSFLRHGKLWQCCKTAEHIHQVGIGEGIRGNQTAEVIHGRRYRLDEMALPLEVSPEPIGTEHLEGAEEDEEREALHEMMLRRHLGEGLQRLVVFVDEFPPQFLRIFGGSLPEERGDIVVERPLPSALEVDERRVALAVEHHIPCLEVAVHETVGVLCHQVFGKQAEVGLQFQFVEIEVCGFEETVFEIVEVEQHVLLIELRLGVTVLPFEPPCATYLEVGQLPDGLHQQLLFGEVVASTGITSSFQGIEEGAVAQVFLQIAQTVIADGENLWHRQLSLFEMAGEIEKGVVLVEARPHHTDYRMPLVVEETVIPTVAARPL